MTLIDTNILSTFAKIGRLDLLFNIFGEIEISANVFEEIEQAFELGYPHASTLLKLVKNKRISVISPDKSEIVIFSELPDSFGQGERDSIAIARERNKLLVSNDTSVVNYCNREEIDCVRLSTVLRYLWKKNILSKEEVKKLIEDKDNVVISQQDEIFRE
ncbi:MAG: hypothetical protein SVV03_01370 [Candidatus Nanohaloarchaea archaeon]|nr:hypothetical protein [Candidatus Nanohaloarchaea archaeon]